MERIKLRKSKQYKYVADNHYKRMYGISLEDYNKMLKNQNEVCAICSKVCITGRALAVDHCHKTGKIRGLLCAHCNTALGRFNDDPVMLEKAIKYLKEANAHS